MCTQQLFLLQFMTCSYWSSACHPSGSLPVCKTCIVLYVLGQCIIIVSTVTSHWREALKMIYFDWQQWFQPTFLPEVYTFKKHSEYWILQPTLSKLPCLWHSAIIKHSHNYGQYPSVTHILQGPFYLHCLRQFLNQGFPEAQGSAKHHKCCTKNRGIHL